jgi:tetratricopeptide (TPR) repeat protein
MLKHDVPASAKAYEFYLRANQLATNYPKASLARDLYLECLQEDPRYAPAWARLGRVHRLLTKFFDTNPQENLNRAESAFIRALKINPDLSVAHNLFGGPRLRPLEQGRGAVAPAADLYSCRADQDAAGGRPRYDSSRCKACRPWTRISFCPL